jgi:hypothetical protein
MTMGMYGFANGGEKSRPEEGKHWHAMHVGGEEERTRGGNNISVFAFKMLRSGCYTRNGSELHISVVFGHTDFHTVQ